MTESVTGIHAVVTDLFTSSTAQAVAAVLILCVLIAIGFFLVASFRDYTAQDREPDDDVLANLREMHRRGDINEREFRTIESITERQLASRRPSPESEPSQDVDDDPSHSR